MASNSSRKSGSSAGSTRRKKVVISAQDTSRVRNTKSRPEGESTRQVKPTRSGKTAGAGQRAANSKRDERERRLRIQKRKLYLRAALIVLCVAGVVGGVVSIYRSDVFLVEQIEVSGGSHLTQDEIRAIAAMPEGATLLRFPGQGMKERLEADAWIAGATVARDFPDTVTIRVTERVPIALVDRGDASFWLADADGYMIAQSAPATDTAMVVIRDVVGLDPQPGKKTMSEPLLNALAVWQGLSEELQARVRAISAASIDKTALITSDDIEIFVGDAEDIKTKDAVARRILEEEAGNVVYINVRTVDRPTWRGVEGE